MTTREIYDRLGDAATKLAEIPHLAGVIIIGITNEVTDDNAQRHSLMAMAVKTSVDKYPLYLEMGIESLKKAMENGPVEQSSPE